MTQVQTPVKTEATVTITEAEYLQLQNKANRLDKFLDMDRWETPTKMFTTISYSFIHLMTDSEWIEKDRHSKGMMGERLQFFYKSLSDLLLPDCKLY